MENKKIAIVGAGVGGLSTAARLAKQGYDVEVFEKLPECGGRNHLLESRGFKFDMGPSFVLMPDFFSEAFSYCGQNIDDYLTLKALDCSYKIFYHDTETLTVYRDSRKTREELEKIEKGSSKGFAGFIKEIGRIYDEVRPLLYDCFTPRALTHPRYWGLLGKIHALETYWGLAKKFFKTDKLRFAFTFEAMFIGVSPFAAPAFYSIISYADHVQKIFHPMGGMYQIPLAFERLAKNYGARFYYNTEVNAIERDNGSIRLRFKGGERSFNQTVVNADYAYTQSTLLSRHIPEYEYSCSVYLLYLGLKRKVTGLAHHNLFFSSDVIKNLNQIFRDKVMPDDPSFYMHVPTVTDPSLAPEGKDIFYILIPVPNLKNQREDMSGHEARLRKIVFEKINRTAGITTEDLIEVEHRFLPQDFISRYNIRYGATFGLSHTLKQSAFFRPPNFDSQIKGLYFVGASTQPGGGLPVVIAGSRIVADLMSGALKRG